MLCAGGNRSLSTSKNSTSNFQKHQESQRCTLQLVEKTKQEAQHRLMHEVPDTTQQKMDFGGRASSNPSSRTELKRLVGRCVEEEMLPLNMVDSSSFRAIIPQIQE